IEELEKLDCDAVLIPEKSANRNVVGRLLDLQRDYLVRYVKVKGFSPYVVAVPRCFKREKLLNINVKDLNVVSHEDSVLYYEAFNSLKSFCISNHVIFNEDPPFFEFLKKYYKYGKSTTKPSPHDWLISKLDKNRVIYDRDVGFNWGILVDLVKGIPYLLGKVFG
ncbi:hypothetical protein, partial [Acidianus sp. RZ1]|uniref:hypothetical protein n=1 Tax=Acidianus sp. RZ1 TaxID=1540082 RepID=UPI00149163C5